MRLVSWLLLGVEVVVMLWAVVVVAGLAFAVSAAVYMTVVGLVCWLRSRVNRGP